MLPFEYDLVQNVKKSDKGQHQILSEILMWRISL